MTDVDLDLFDPSGSIVEAAERAGLRTRPGFLRRLAGLATGLALFPGFGATDEADATPADDIGLLNFALALEYFAVRFYETAGRTGALKSPQARTFVRVAAEHERAHLRAILKPLGRHAVKEPKFDYHGSTEDERMFRTVAQGMEDISVHAWLGQHARFKGPFRHTAARIMTNEARHCAWMRAVNGGVGQDVAAPVPFDVGWTVQQIKDRINPTGFYVGGFPDVP